jgi:hypothetical protein
MPYKSLAIYRNIYSKSKLQIRNNKFKRASNFKRKKPIDNWKNYFRHIPV